MRQFLAMIVVSTVMLSSIGCGRNKFQQEVDTEKVAVNFAREVERGDYGIVTAEELKELLDKETDMVIVDAMPYEASYKSAHLPGAKQFLFSKEKEMEEWDSDATGGKSKDDFEELLGDDKEKLIVVYCGFVKCLRSHNAAMWARKLGYKNVKRFPGGIYAWKGKGYPTEKE